MSVRGRESLGFGGQKRIIYFEDNETRYRLMLEG